MRDLGDSGSIDEINESVLERENFLDAQQAALHGDGPGTEIARRLAWARSAQRHGPRREFTARCLEPQRGGSDLSGSGTSRTSAADTSPPCAVSPYELPGRLYNTRNHYESAATTRRWPRRRRLGPFVSCIHQLPMVSIAVFVW
ncbi:MULTISPECIES: hypothetical protein [Mycobacterium]|uniref:hypothetical protein n=1 Tax=Mycobacterium sp. TaxID=1785 RepID=UPI002F91AAF5